MAVSDFLWGGSSPSTVTGTATTDQFFPAWYTDYVKGILSKANAVVSSPYPAYPGPRVADLTADEQSGLAGIRSNVGAANPAINSGISMVSQAGAPGLNQGIFNTYTSPHLTGVVNRIAELGGRNLSENLLPSVNDTFIGAGQFGSGRHADFTGRAVRDANESILGQQAQALQAGFETSLDAYNAAQNRGVLAGEKLGALGQMKQASGLIDSTALLSSGALQRELSQRGMDLGYEEFLRQAEYPKTQLGFLSSLLRGTPVPTSTSQITTQQQSGGVNPLASLLGLAAGATGVKKLFE